MNIIHFEYLQRIIKPSLKFFSGLVFVVGLFAIYSIAHAQNIDEEAILSFDSEIVVNADNSLDVTEKISYTTGPIYRHGIYRDIYPFSSFKKRMRIENISVVDQNGIPYTFDITDDSSNFRIKIGEPDQTFSGEKIYIIKYHATRSVAHFDDFDEIYWNVTGDNWIIPIYQARASVVLPGGANMLRSACYFGPHGSTNQCNGAQLVSGSYFFDLNNKLARREGFTIAIAFPKGFVGDYTSSFFEDLYFYLKQYFLLVITLLILLGSIIYLIRDRYKNGREPKGTGVIVPQYDVCDNLAPIEVQGLVDKNINNTSISAEIIYLATKGYLKIVQFETVKFFGMRKTVDYEIVKLKDSLGLENDFDKHLMGGLFAGGVKSIKISSLKNKFFSTSKQVLSSAEEGLYLKNYYKEKSRSESIENYSFLLLIGVFLMIGFGQFLEAGILFISLVLFVVYLPPMKTIKGVLAYEHILGLKEYLQIAEKNRLLFHNSPESKPETFEKLLPYAMVLGVAKIWAEEFKDLYNNPPTWYEGSTSTGFDVVNFTSSLDNFSALTYSLNSSSDGSSGGGSSGGGGGGGGGGGW